MTSLTKVILHNLFTLAMQSNIVNILNYRGLVKVIHIIENILLLQLWFIELTKIYYFCSNYKRFFRRPSVVYFYLFFGVLNYWYHYIIKATYTLYGYSQFRQLSGWLQSVVTLVWLAVSVDPYKYILHSYPP